MKRLKTIYGVIMAGGSGTRFWPLSKERTPKQLLNLTGDRTLIQKAIHRIEPVIKHRNVFIVTGNSHVKEIKAQLGEIPSENIIVEPFGRNTAPCIGLAALHIKKRDPDGVVAVLPADHLIKDEGRFRKLISIGSQIAHEKNLIITLGIKPSYPETGYGYIQAGKKLEGKIKTKVFTVNRFTEKPDIKRARRFVASGSYFWNSGVFIWKVNTILEMIRRFLPDLFDGLMEIEKVLETEKEKRVVKNVYSRIKGISIDHAIMEKADNVAVIPCDTGWNDIGTWMALYDILEKDNFNNAVVGDYAAIDTEGCIIHSPKKLVATIGLKDLVIVAAKDSILICPKEKSQDVKKIVEILKKRGLKRYL